MPDDFLNNEVTKRKKEEERTEVAWTKGEEIKSGDAKLEDIFADADPKSQVESTEPVQIEHSEPKKKSVCLFEFF